MMIVVILNRPKAIIRGVLRNALIEPQPNVFIGNLDSKRISEVVSMLEQTNTQSLVCVSGKAPMGFKIKVINPMPLRTVVSLDGIDLVKRITKSNK